MINEERSITVEKDTYETADINLAAYLRYIGYEILRITWKAKQAIFIFKNCGELRKSVILYDYYNRKTTVEPLRYMEILREIKSMLRNV